MTENLSVTTTRLDAGRGFITLINVFTVTPDHQAPFIESQISEYKQLAGKSAGVVAANLHRGLGGTKAINYAQFYSVEELRACPTSDLMKEHPPIIRPYLERVEPGLYRAVETISREGRPVHIEAGAGQLALIVVMFARSTGARGPDQVVAGQREAARQLLDKVPGLRSLTLHRGLVAPRDGQVGGASNAALAWTMSSDWALYAQLDGADAGDALIQDPLYRAWFTAENPHVGRAEQEVYEVAYVQNEAARRALRQ